MLKYQKLTKFLYFYFDHFINKHIINVGKNDFINIDIRCKIKIIYELH